MMTPTLLIHLRIRILCSPGRRCAPSPDLAQLFLFSTLKLRSLTSIDVCASPVRRPSSEVTYSNSFQSICPKTANAFDPHHADDAALLMQLVR